jgi:2-keto-4-pentenoate hydratase
MKQKKCARKHQMTMDNAIATEIAGRLLREHRTGSSFKSLEEVLTIDDAYVVQRAFVNTLKAGGAGDTKGYKIGLTSKPMQKMCGITHPVAGVVLGSGVHSSPCTLRCGDYGRLGIESELCIVAGDDIEVGLSTDEMLERLASIHAAFEIVDDRHADYRALHASSLIADNSWNAGVVIGQPGSTSLLSSPLAGSLSINGVLADQGSSGDALEGAISVVQWLTEHLSKSGEKLRAGQFVMTGSVVTTTFVKAGDILHFELSDLPPVFVTIGA